MTIKGSGFVSGATVTIGNAATAVNVVSATEITAVTAAAAAGSDEVVVTDANGTSTGGPSYTYVAPPPPKVTSITPTSGTSAGGTKVTIKGTRVRPRRNGHDRQRGDLGVRCLRDQDHGRDVCHRSRL